MKILEIEDQWRFISRFLKNRYGRLPPNGVHHKKKSWLRWFFSSRTQRQIRKSFQSTSLK